jgi:hypothetical protein
MSRPPRRGAGEEPGTHVFSEDGSHRHAQVRSSGLDSCPLQSRKNQRKQYFAKVTGPRHEQGADLLRANPIASGSPRMPWNVEAPGSHFPGDGRRHGERGDRHVAALRASPLSRLRSPFSGMLRVNRTD